MEMKQITKRIMAYVLTFAMVFSSAAAVQPTKVEAASSKYVKSLTVSKSAKVEAGKKTAVKVTVKVAGKASKEVKVKSSNKKIVKASYSKKTRKITLTGVKKGSAKVTVTTKAKNKKGKTISKKINVTVTQKAATDPSPGPSPSPTPAPKPSPVAVTSVTMTKTTTAILKGNTEQLFATVAPENATDRSLVWSSSAPAVATVTNTGLVKAVSRGTVVITARNAASGKSAACTVTVLDEVTVATQNELNNALSSAYTGKIILKPETDITIPAGNYAGTELVIQAASGSVVTNEGTFGSVAISGGTYSENAATNSLLITAAAEVTIGENSNVDVTVAIVDNSAADVKLENNGTISNLAIQSAGMVSIEGEGTSSSEVPIPVNISTKDVTLSSNQNINVNASAKAQLMLTGDTDKTTVTVDKTANLPDIFGVGFISYTVTEIGETGTIAAEESGDLEPVDIEGAVKDAYTGEALSDVEVYLIPYKDYKGSDLLRSSEVEETTGETEMSGKKAITDEYGKYKYTQVDSGNYYLVVKQEGYKDAVQLLTASSRFNVVYQNEVMELLDASVEDNQTATLSGTVTDAANGAGIANITVELRRNKGNIIGSPIAAKTTDEKGFYSFEGLEADQYTLQFRDTNETDEEKYILLSKNACVKADLRSDVSMTLSKPIKGSGIRFVLTWGSEGEGVPSDLDSHLFAPTVDGGYKEIYYDSMYYRVGNQIYAMLDVDDTSYEGPETSTILSDIKGIYYYYVYNYTNGGNLPTSRARVDVYSGNELLTSYNVPSTQANTGDWWKVCNYNSTNRSISSYNLILDELDLNPEYTGSNTAYIIESIESSSGQIEWSEKNKDYNDDDYDNYDYTGLYIKGSAYNWDDVQSSLTVKMIDGYSYAWGESTEDGVDAVLDILKDGKKVGYYNVYYSFDVFFDIAGDGVVGYEKEDSTIYIYSTGPVDYNKLTYPGLDTGCEAKIEGDDGDYSLVIYRKDSHKEVQRYWLYNSVGRYISDVTGSYIQNFYESSSYIDVSYDYDYEDDLDWNDVRFTLAAGYTGEVVLQESYDEEDDYYYNYYALQIKDSSGSVVATKRLYWEW